MKSLIGSALYIAVLLGSMFSSPNFGVAQESSDDSEAVKACQDRAREKLNNTITNVCIPMIATQGYDAAMACQAEAQALFLVEFERCKNDPSWNLPPDKNSCAGGAETWECTEDCRRPTPFCVIDYRWFGPFKWSPKCRCSETRADGSRKEDKYDPELISTPGVAEVLESAIQDPTFGYQGTEAVESATVDALE